MSPKFYIEFPEDYAKSGDILDTCYVAQFKVLEKPYKKWYKKLLQFITFGWYKAPYQYKVQLYEKD